MNRCLLCLPLLALAPFANFFGFYLAGLGVIDAGFGMLIGALALIPIMLGVALVFGFAVPASNFVRYWVCLGAIAAQLGLVAAGPGGARAEVRGVARRLKQELPISNVRSCADQLLERYKAGTLVSAEPDRTARWSDSTFWVADSQLPTSLQGRFRWVQIRKAEQGLTDERQVFFFIDSGRSIICDSRSFVSGVCLYSIDKGVHAYHNSAFAK